MYAIACGSLLYPRSAFPQLPIQLDVKVATPGLVPAVHKLVAAHPGRRERLLWGSFLHQARAAGEGGGTCVYTYG
jgi:hypothetical protein